LSAAQDVPVAIVPASQPEVVEAALVRAARVVAAGLESGDVWAESWGVDPDGRGKLSVDGVEMTVPLRGVPSRNRRRYRASLGAHPGGERSVLHVAPFGDTSVGGQYRRTDPKVRIRGVSSFHRGECALTQKRDRSRITGQIRPGGHSM
jgi:hypothetical protein